MLEPLEDRRLLSVAPQLVADINPLTTGGGPGDYGVCDVGGIAYFRGHTQTTGMELWKSDGTAAGTVMVKDIYPGSSGGGAGNLTNVGGTLFFSAIDGVHGGALWKSDGTAAGTVMVKDVWPGNSSNFANVNGTLFFHANDGATGYELWKSDGTTAGTVLVKDIYPWSNSSFRSYLTNVGGTLFFRANDGTHGYEVWKSDGTDAGTVMVKDIFAGSGTSYPGGFTNVGGTLFFAANGGAGGGNLWKSDGTVAGTVQVNEIHPASYGSNFNYLTGVGGTLFFVGYDAAHGWELWKSDGTAAGTVLVKDILPGSDSASPSNLTNVGGTLFFQANDGAHGTELWTSDGTTAGTILVKDVLPGSNSAGAGYLTNVGGTLLFTADDSVHGSELWKSDGTTAGTVLVKDILPGSNTSHPRYFTNVGGTLFFQADDGVHGYGLWKSAGTAAGTVMVKDIGAGGVGSNPMYLTNVAGTMLFLANDGTHGLELWKSDGTATGTLLVKDINPGSEDSAIINTTTQMVNVGGTLYFRANDGTHGWELWKSDGTAAGTMMLKDICLGSGDSHPWQPTNVSGTLFFRANDGTHGDKLWKSDGTAAGTVMVKDGALKSDGSYPAYLANVGGTLFFSGYDSIHGSELWKSDGTAAGTVMVKDVRPGSNESRLRFLTNAGGTLYFRANDGTHGYELWKSDGTAAGTVLVKDICPGNTFSNSYPTFLTNVGGTLFFRANDGVHGRELWKSDGTTAGTVLVKDIRPGSDYSNLGALTNVGGTLLFSANDGAHGYELWKSDGTDAGTVMVKDIYAGDASSGIRNVITTDGTLFFQANDGVNGDELWMSDGTAAGTVMVADIAVPGGSNPGYLCEINGVLFFAAMDDTHGRELWKLDYSPTDIALSSNTVPENQAAGTVVGTFTTTDQNLPSDSHTYSLVDSGTYPDNLAFAIVGNRLQTAAQFDYETKPTYSIRVRTTDSGELSYDETFTVTVTGLNETPTDILFSKNTITRNSPSGTVVGDLSTIDPDVGDSFTYSLVDSAGGRFKIDGGQLQVDNSDLLGTQMAGVQTVVVRSTDSGGLSIDRSFSIHVLPMMSPHLVADINPTATIGGSGPNSFCELGGIAYFMAGTPTLPGGLWRSDGTTAGTVLVKYFWSGGSSYLTNVGGTLFLAADDAHGRELWKSDGTAAGTVLVKDICPGSDNSSPSNFTNVGGTLFFTANDGTHGPELWKSDGTATGTVLVKDILAGTGSSNIKYPTAVGGTLFFQANDGAHSVELWKSDGTAAGTVLVKDICPGSYYGSAPEYLTNVGGTLFFSAYQSATSRELWKSDGTTAGTVLVKDIWPGSSDAGDPRRLTNVSGRLFFIADDAVNGWELWKSDGTAAGTVLVKDIRPGSGSWPTDLTNVSGTLFFGADDGAHGYELWKSDGTSAGTMLVKDNLPGTSSGGLQGKANVNGTLFFISSDSTALRELWKSDGTAAGTILVKDIRPGYGGSYPRSLTNVAGTLFFQANDGTHGSELWKSDGTSAGTAMVKDIGTGSISSVPRYLTNAGGTLFFGADDVNTRELLKSDGTAAGTVPVGSFYDPKNLTYISGTLFFTTYDNGQNATKLWKSDGTVAGTVTIKVFKSGYVIPKASNFTNVGGTLYFRMDEGTSGFELWKSDGTAPGTVMVKDILDGYYNSAPTFFANVSGTLFFSANDGANGYELWKSNGTASGTVLVKDIRAGSGSSNPYQLVNAGGTLFFLANDGANGMGLWKSNGTAAGTSLVKKNVSTGGSSRSGWLENVGGTLLFLNENDGGLWKSDGTTAGTVLVKSIVAAGKRLDSRFGSGYLTKVDGTLFFRVHDDFDGWGLWKSDGTTAGTVMVKDLNGIGDASFYDNFGPNNLVNAKGVLFFRAYDSIAGWELWKSNGTTAGTVMVADIGIPGSSTPGELTEVNGKLFFDASDEAHGRELWMLDATTITSIATSPNPSIFGQSVTLTATVSADALGSGTPTGTVTFRDGITTLGTGILSGGTASFTTSGLSAGSHSITVVYDGDADFLTSTSEILVQGVGVDPTTTVVVASANPSVYGQSVTFAATVSADLPGAGTPSGIVTFKDGATTLGTGILTSGTATFTTSALAAGNHSITALYGGDTNFRANTSAPLSQAVNQDSTTTTIVAVPTPSVYGQSVTFTATVSANLPGAGTPSGTVTFMEGTTTLGTGTLTGGTANFTTSALATGSHSISTLYNGDTNFLTSTAATLSQSVNQDSTTTAVVASPNPSVFGQPATFTATVSVNAPGGGTPTGTVQFVVDGANFGSPVSLDPTGHASLTSLSLLGGVFNMPAGLTSLEMVSVGNPGNAVDENGLGSVAYSYQIGEFEVTAGQYTEFLNAKAKSDPYGLYNANMSDTSRFGGSGCNIQRSGSNGSYVYSVASEWANRPVNWVSFWDACRFVNWLSNGQGNGDTETGTYTLNGFNGEDGRAITRNAGAELFLPSQDEWYKAAFHKNNGATGDYWLYPTRSDTAPSNVLSSSGTNNANCYDGSYTLGYPYYRTEVGAFSSSPSAYGTYDQGGNVMEWNETVFYQGSDGQSRGYEGGAYGMDSWYMSTLIGGGGDPSTAEFGSRGFRVAGVPEPGCITLDVGSHTITAVYSGDGNFTVSTASPLTDTVNPAATSTTVRSVLPNPSVFGQLVTIVAAVAPVSPGAGTPTGAVTFLEDATVLGTAPLDGSGQATFTTSVLTTGMHAITASYEGDTDFVASTSVAMTQTVDPAGTTTTIVASPNPSLYGQLVTFTATVSASLPGVGTPVGTVTFLEGATVLSTVPLDGSGQAAFTTSVLTAGPHAITASYSGGTDFFASTSDSVIQMVDPAPLIVTADNQTMVYGAELPTLTVHFAGFVLGDTAASLDIQPTVMTTATSASHVGSYTITADGASDSDYTITYVDGTLSVTTAALTITADNQTKVYGAAMPVLTYSVSGLVGGDTLTTPPTLLSAATDASHVGRYTITASGAANPDYTIAYADGTLSVTPAPLTIAADNKEKIFGGLLPVLTVSYAGLVNGDTSANLAVLPTVSTTATATSPLGVYAITAAGAADPDYAISYVPGTLAVVKRGTTVSVVASSPNTSVFGQSMTFTALVSAASGLPTPVGKVVFYRDGRVVGRALLDASGRASISTSILAVGSHAITAAYRGNRLFQSSISDGVTQTVIQTTTAMLLTASTAPALFGDLVTFTATVSAVAPGRGRPKGKVTFFDGSAILGTVNVNALGRATFRTSALSSGGHAITASYSGNAKFLATDASLAEVVAQATTITTVVTSPLPTVFGETVKFTAIVSAMYPAQTHSPTGSVTFSDGGALLGTIALDSKGRATLSTSVLTAGVHAITATYGGGEDFAGSSGSVSVQIKPSPGAATLAVQEASASSPASGINDAAIASLLAEWDSQDSLNLLDSLSSALSA
jgi:ELWxxDGT repeat protein